MNRSTTDLPLVVDDTSEVPNLYRGLYELRNDYRYQLSAGGRELEKVRQQIRDGANYEPTPSKKKTTPVVSKQDWLNATAVANQTERKALLQAAARGEIKVAN